MEKSECSSGYVESIGVTEGGSVKRVENNKSVFRKKVFTENYISCFVGILALYINLHGLGGFPLCPIFISVLSVTNVCPVV